MQLKKIVKMDKRGQVGLDTAKAVMLALMTLGVIAFALIIALNQLNSTSVATAQTTSIVNNITGGTASFFGNTATWFALLSIVIVILIVSIVIYAVNRFGGGSSGSL